MKYGSFLPLFTSSQADITLFVSGFGPHENTPIFETYKKNNFIMFWHKTCKENLHRNVSFEQISENWTCLVFQND